MGRGGGEVAAAAHDHQPDSSTCRRYISDTVGGFIFMGTNFSGLNYNDKLMGTRFRCHNIFLHNLYQKSLFCGYWNLCIRLVSMKITKIGTLQKLSHSKKFVL